MRAARGHQAFRSFRRTLTVGLLCARPWPWCVAHVGARAGRGRGAVLQRSGLRTRPSCAMGSRRRLAATRRGVGRGHRRGVEQLAQAQAQTLDLGLIGTSLTAEQCDGSPGPSRLSSYRSPSASTTATATPAKRRTRIPSPDRRSAAGARKRRPPPLRRSRKRERGRQRARPAGDHLGWKGRRRQPRRRRQGTRSRSQRRR